ncbi:MAG: hypothetical protein K6G33_07965, partial [Ruminococcus sp.]|uniref:hypothetical protein n=1 Tax=Ruminococcus sp. TaxID=41978 RepID=UPI0025F0198F
VSCHDDTSSAFLVWLADLFYYSIGGFIFLLIAKAFRTPSKTGGFQKPTRKDRYTRDICLFYLKKCSIFSQ